MINFFKIPDTTFRCGSVKCRNCPVTMPSCQLRNGLCPGCFAKSKSN